MFVQASVTHADECWSSGVLPASSLYVVDRIFAAMTGLPVKEDLELG